MDFHSTEKKIMLSCSTTYELYKVFKPSLVVVRHAVDVAVMVHGERHPIQSLGAHHTAKTAGMVRVPKSLQDLKMNQTSFKKRTDPFFKKSFHFPLELM